MNSAVRVPRVLSGTYSALVGFLFSPPGGEGGRGGVVTDLGFDSCAV
jgi:hypothetical protein